MTSAMDPVRELLDLLRRGAPAEEFARPAAAARGGGADAAEQEAVEEATSVALEIRRTLDQHRRREAELTALFDTAGDLAALRDLDAVLRAIVHRARMLLGTDVAYLTLNDPVAGDTFMRVTDGSVSAAFQQLRLGMGEGLGGLVAQTARPYASADYRGDDRFRHTRTIDSGVREEGLRGILGVPLRVGTRVIGVLYAADRQVREFAPDAVALLSSLADHAAVAIDGARLLEETRATLIELNAATERARAHSEAMRLAAETHDRLTHLVLRGGDVADVAREVAALLGGGLVVHDADGVELARVAADPREPSAQAPSPHALAASRSGGRAVAVDGVWVCAVLAGPELLGGLTLVGRADLADSDRRLFERAGLVTALLLLLRRSVAHAEDRVRGELLGDLLTPGQPGRPRDTGSHSLRARKLGVVLTRPHAVVVLHCEAALRSRLTTEAARHAQARDGLAGLYQGRVVLLAPAEEPGVLARSLADDLGKALGAPVTAGAGGPAAGPQGLPDAYAEALRCLEALHALGHTGYGAGLPDLGFLGVLLGDRTDVSGYVRQVLGPVIDYDARRGTELVLTLEAYFAHGSSLTRTKDALHVHVNTVVQRLERIGNILGEDWNAPARALEIQLALRVLRVSDRGRVESHERGGTGA
ncbi:MULTISPECIES: GAF domain-containing protein [unclassified Streptomyces]|uniref:helix-turn-helix domain-containing protein n=1 Tax=unclassified Streptomyces TaxID=2593676 RepID=UPI00225255F9|nr:MULTISPECIES: GAF domain-containing protein [unclassified Streptomyces]MCX4524186.1 helix-turn-helix domain-containing protein [Streptomyces sp. NBC_01551]MCX4545295.1 helix-turn-helix domain-containing protein [Streptomyces sp. NBC_01565]